MVAVGESADDVRKAATCKASNQSLVNLGGGVAVTAAGALPRVPRRFGEVLVSGVGLAALHFVGLGVHGVFRYSISLLTC